MIASGLDAPVKRMVVMEALAEKIVQLFVDNFTLDQQPLRTYFYHDDSAPPSLRIITQVSGSTIFNEWNEKTNSITVRNDIFKDYAFRMWLVRTPGNDAVPTKLVVPEQLNKLYRTTGPVDNSNPGKLLLNLPTDRKIQKVLNSFDQNSILAIVHCNANDQDC